MYLGDFPVGGVVDFNFTSRQFTTGQPFLLAGTPMVRVYKSSGTTEDDSGITLVTNFDTVTGLNHVSIDLSADGTFYAAGSECSIVLTAGTVDGVSVAGETLAHFSIERAGGVLALAKGANGFAAIKTDTGTTLYDLVVNSTNYLFTEVNSRLAAADYTAPDNSGITAIKAKTDNLPANPAAVSDIPTAATNAAAVWDESYAGHLTAGTFGNVVANLPDAATTAYTVWQADPAGWSAAAGTFGKLLIDAEIDAGLIKVVTDQFTFTIPGQVNANAESMNGAEILGDGSPSNLWRGA